MHTTSTAERLRALAVTSRTLTVSMSPAVVAALVVRRETLALWPDEVRWDVLDAGDPADMLPCGPVIAHHVGYLAAAVLVAGWHRALPGGIALIARDHAQPVPAWAVLTRDVPPG